MFAIYEIYVRIGKMILPVLTTNVSVPSKPAVKILWELLSKMRSESKSNATRKLISSINGMILNAL